MCSFKILPFNIYSHFYDKVFAYVSVNKSMYKLIYEIHIWIKILTQNAPHWLLPYFKLNILGFYVKLFIIYFLTI